MPIELLFIAVGFVLFVGMFLGLLLSYREVEQERTRKAKRIERRPAPALFGWQAQNRRIAEELMLRQIEHHLRREAMLAEEFVMNPNPRTLRAGEDLRLGAN